MSAYNPFSLEGKTVFVTGASSGIGKAIAIECSKMGAAVIINGRNAGRLNDTFSRLQGKGHAQFIADIADAAVLDELVAGLPEFDGIVHCAGIAAPLPFQFVSPEKIREIFSVNFDAPVILTQRLVKAKKLRKSSIVFISSISGVCCSFPGSSLYSATKGALHGLIKGMALDLAPKGIRVNSVMPGMIDTAILDAGVISPEQLEEDQKRYPLKRYGRPEEVAHAVIYLLSDASAWVTGSALLIDGGYTLQ